MTLFIRTTNPSTRRQIDANWDFTRSLPLNTWVPLRLNNQLIEVSSARQDLHLWLLHVAAVCCVAPAPWMSAGL
jgi:hypothetical protein